MVAGLLFGAVSTQAVSTLVNASGAGPSPYASCDISKILIHGEKNYPDAEVEPFVATNPREPNNIVGVWQQDRYTFGGSRGLRTGVSLDGGLTWKRNSPHFSVCSGGTPKNGGNYDRASDPWVTFSPDGTSHQISLSFDTNALTGASPANQGILVSRSTDKGNEWSEPITLQFDNDPVVSQDKESITADPQNSKLVYAVWDRLIFDPTFTRVLSGPTWFARTTDGGKSWEPARIIFDPRTPGQPPSAANDAQTIGNIIVVLPTGDLVDMALRIFHATEVPPTTDPNDFAIVVLRSKDKGLTWSKPIVVNTLESLATTNADGTGIHDPKTGAPVRTGDIVPSIAVDNESGALYVVWQDARFSSHTRDGIALSKSTDGELTWSKPIQVNKVPAVQAFTASVDVADRNVSVTYYDFRNDNADKNVLLTDYWKAISEDDGKTFNERHVGGSFDMRTAPVARGFFVGDYEGLTHLQDQFVPFFVMTNSGNFDNRTDVFVKPLGDQQEENGQSGANQQQATSGSGAAAAQASAANTARTTGAATRGVRTTR
jgi:hypothetical protein